jgi:hypothetical protein
MQNDHLGADVRQAANAVMMVRPVGFGSNPQTLASNAFQRPAPAASDEQLRTAALLEFEALAAALVSAGIEVRAYEPADGSPTPDAVFPNNWFSTHADGTVVLYPMQAANRRLERRLELLDGLRADGGFRITRLVDLSHLETGGEYLEGTGSLVLDRTRRIAYACLSPRTSPTALAAWADELGYEVVAFSAVDARGQAIYHTNVMLCVGTRFAAACLAAVPQAAERDALRNRLTTGGRELIELTLEQLDCFAGNMLELRDQDGASVIVMSQCAAGALDATQRAALQRHGRLVAVPVPTIEAAGGGSVRCMLAEVFLPREVSNV